MMDGLRGPLSHFSSFVHGFVLLSLFGTSSALAQVSEVVPILEIDKKIVTYDDTGQELEMDDLGEVLVGTPIFFKYRVSYTGYITSTGTVTVTVPITDTFPVGLGIDLLRIRDDMGTLNPDDAFTCIRASVAITDTIPVGTTPSITSTLPITGTVIFTDTTPFLPGDGFECISSSATISDTQTVFTPRSGGGYVNTAVATVGPCVDDCEPSASDNASYVGLYWAFTPGFWKNHTGDRRSRGQDAWAYTPYAPEMLLGSVFQAPSALSGKTLLDALQFKGGKGPEGATRILLRASMAALLNASFHETMNNPLTGPNGELLLPDGRTLFPYESLGIQEMVNSLLAIGNRDAMLLIAEQLDDFNDGIHYIDWSWVPPLR
jgi:hypothetical protein